MSADLLCGKPLDDSPTAQKYLIETMGGGVALLDFNNDGLLDIFFVNSGRLDDSVKPPAHFARGDAAYWNRLYRQNHDGSFTDVTERAGLARAGDANYGMGVATGDYDNDGFTDLYVTRYLDWDVTHDILSDGFILQHFPSSRAFAGEIKR